jgi:hypothetical protein
MYFVSPSLGIQPLLVLVIPHGGRWGSMALLLAVAKVALAATPVLGLVHEVKEELDRVVLHQRAHKMTRFGLEIGHSL